jgi:hypothetical protein
MSTTTTTMILTGTWGQLEQFVLGCTYGFQDVESWRAGELDVEIGQAHTWVEVQISTVATEESFSSEAKVAI